MFRCSLRIGRLPKLSAAAIIKVQNMRLPALQSPSKWNRMAGYHRHTFRSITKFMIHFCEQPEKEGYCSELFFQRFSTDNNSTACCYSSWHYRFIRPSKQSTKLEVFSGTTPWKIWGKPLKIALLQKLSLWGYECRENVSEFVQPVTLKRQNYPLIRCWKKSSMILEIEKLEHREESHAYENLRKQSAAGNSQSSFHWEQSNFKILIPKQMKT